MDKIMSFRKMNIKTETEHEFYLNPRDVFLNGRLNFELLNNSELFHYLPFNEIFVVLFDEYISIIDIKESITNCVKIITQINYEKIYEANFPKKSSDVKKVDQSKNNIKNNSGHLKIDRKSSDEDKKIKTFNVFEIKNIYNSLCFIIEYFNQDFIIFKYEDIKDEKTFKLIYKSPRDEFLKKIISFMSSNNSFGFKNNCKEAFIESSNNDINSICRYVELNIENFNKLKPSKEDDINTHLVVMKVNNIIDLSTIYLNPNNLNDSFSIDYFYSIDMDIINLIAKIFKDVLIMVLVNSDNDLIIKFFNLKFNIPTQRSFKLQCNFLNEQRMNFGIFNNHSMINYIDLDENKLFTDTNEKTVFLLVAKIEKIFLYTLNNNNNNDILNFNLTKIFVIEEMSISVVRHVFILNNYIFAFNNKGLYTNEKLNISKQDNTKNVTENNVISTIIHASNSISIVRDIFSIKKFYNGLGFFILGSNSMFKGNEFNICYFLPEQFRNRNEILDILVHSNYKTFEYLSRSVYDTTRKKFFSFCLGEYLGILYRYQDYIPSLFIIDNDKIILHYYELNDENIILANEFLNLLINRLKVYVSMLKKEYQDEESENNIEIISEDKISPSHCKNYIIHQFRSIVSNSIDDINDEYEYEYGEYLCNEEYTCGICVNKHLLVKYIENKRSYACLMGHLIFSCCVSYLPVTDKDDDIYKQEGNINSNFYSCEKCKLIYSENKIKLCLVCQQILNVL